MLIYKFESLLKEGEAYHLYLFQVAPNTSDPKIANNDYRLNFQYSTQVKHLKSSIIPSVADTFEPISILLAPGLDANVLHGNFFFYSKSYFHSYGNASFV